VELRGVLGSVPIYRSFASARSNTAASKALQKDIDNLKAAATAAGVPHDHVFMPATAPSGVGINEYYKTGKSISTRSECSR
jgi:5-methyltetrahydropteroyltriglutamate--homocysteine methyltransferase